MPISMIFPNNDWKPSRKHQLLYINILEQCFSTEILWNPRVPWAVSKGSVKFVIIIKAIVLNLFF
jgi:hypothetical protein